MPLTLISSPRFADHVTPPGHPERVERADVLDVVADRWRARGGRVIAPREASRDELARVHEEAYLDALEATRGRAAMLDPDTFTSPAVTCGRGARSGRCALRPRVDPPGGRRCSRGRSAGRSGTHAPVVRLHSCARRAITPKPTARWASACTTTWPLPLPRRSRPGLERVAIVDYDVHHGNGTQHSFYRDPRVLFVSTHQYPFYPGTGAAGETGEGDGRGFTVNVPLESGCTDGDYALVCDRVIVPVLDEFAPELVLVSAGFDAHERDPLAHMRMSAAGFGALTARLAAAADRHARGRLLLVTEGGYDLPAFGESLDAVVRVLAGEPVPERA